MSLKSRIIQGYLTHSVDHPWQRSYTEAAVELYCLADDPLSALCLQMAELLEPHLSVPLHIRYISTPPADLYPEPDKQQAFAHQDCQRIAPAWGLAYRPDACKPASGKTPIDPASYGHYLPAMWQFGGQWFWGLDRLPMLCKRLRDQGLLSADFQLPFSAKHANLPAVKPDATLQYYFSFRSPYSYLSVKHVIALRHKHPTITLNVKPVLPMVMRSLPIPKAKRLYIAKDAMRIAREQQQPFGNIADPVGQGAENALKIFAACEGTEQQLAWLKTASNAAFANGLALSKLSNLKVLCKTTNIPWDKAQHALNDPDGLQYAEHNRQAMFALGLWGVPSFQYGELTTWGQDRIWMIEEAIRRNGA